MIELIYKLLLEVKYYFVKADESVLTEEFLKENNVVIRQLLDGTWGAWFQDRAFIDLDGEYVHVTNTEVRKYCLHKRRNRVLWAVLIFLSNQGVDKPSKQ